MGHHSEREIYSSRILHFPIEKVYEAFADPSQLKTWWGPEGFTNTIHEFDLQPGGKWRLTMHGPEKGNYENESVFKTVKPLALVAWTRISQPLFDMEVAFKNVGEDKTEISFRMILERKRNAKRLNLLPTQKTRKILTGWSDIC